MRTALLALCAGALLACARPKPGDLPRVEYGADACARCGMILSEPRFAAGYVDAEGRSVVYDDLGEFLAAAEAAPALKETSFVHDAESGAWLKAKEAVVVQVEGLATPMGSGYAAFKDKAGAERFLARRRQG